jgi:hypothetical protein
MLSPLFCRSLIPLPFLLPLGYLRLSLMAKEIGKLNEANHWISLALEIDPQHSDSIIVHGRLFCCSSDDDLPQATSVPCQRSGTLPRENTRRSVDSATTTPELFYL